MGLKSKKIKKSNTVPSNSFRNLEDLNQYRRHFDASIDSKDDELLFTIDYNSIPREWTRKQIYGSFPFKMNENFTFLLAIEKTLQNTHFLS